MRLYNSLTRKLEDFTPLTPGKVGLYGCGLTPYDYSHLGHAMQGTIFDVLRKYLEFKGFEVVYVRNYTDIDDKIINAAKTRGIKPLDLSRDMILAAEEDFRNIGVSPATFSPKVSGSMLEIINLIEILISKGFAYQTPRNNIYFSVGKFPDYGRLSNQKVENLFKGSRKEVEPDKKDFKDFALWKAQKPGEPFWDSPWGKGRPGWHIECSAMSKKYLGESFDIHGGGKDLIFPHHENEIAQSESAHGKRFASYWVHNGMMNLNGEKMSKSTKNYVLIKDALKLFHPQTIRYLVLTNHYRSDQEYNDKRFRDGQSRIYYYYKSLLNNDFKMPSGYSKNNPLVVKFIEIMDQDLDTVSVFALLDDQFRRLNDGNLMPRQINDFYEYAFVIAKVFGILNKNPKQVVEEIKDQELSKRGVSRGEVEDRLNSRNGLRSASKFSEADAIRTELKMKGILVSDLGDKSLWDPDFGFREGK
ncbi:MAG: cysteine--tRNA ligase [bacterium]|nr:cysteine--tRNA ligase [bacterium]